MFLLAILLVLLAILAILTKPLLPCGNQSDFFRFGFAILRQRFCVRMQITYNVKQCKKYNTIEAPFL